MVRRRPFKLTPQRQNALISLWREGSALRLGLRGVATYWKCGKSLLHTRVVHALMFADMVYHQRRKGHYLVRLSAKGRRYTKYLLGECNGRRRNVTNGSRNGERTARPGH